MDHTYRHSRYGFRKNIIESEEALVRLTGHQNWDRVMRFPKIIGVGKFIRCRNIGRNTTRLNKVYS